MATHTKQVADRVYAVRDDGAMPNAAFVDGGEAGVVVVDARYTPRDARALVDSVRATTGGRLRALVNTHFHCDHTFGNEAVPTDRVIAHQATRARLAELGDAYVETIRGRRPDLAADLEGVRLRLPDETVAQRLVLHLDGVTLDIRHTGVRAHTEGDLTIRIPEAGTLLIGDLIFNGVVPVIADGDVLGLRRALLDLAREGPWDVVVPGHGPVGGMELIEQQIAFVDGVLATTREVLAGGGDVERATRAAAERFGDLLAVEQRIGDWVRKAAAVAAG